MSPGNPVVAVNRRKVMIGPSDVAVIALSGFNGAELWRYEKDNAFITDIALDGNDIVAVGQDHSTFDGWIARLGGVTGTVVWEDEVINSYYWSVAPTLP